MPSSSDAPKHTATPDAPAANAKTEERMNHVKVAATHISPSAAGKAVAPTSKNVDGAGGSDDPNGPSPNAGAGNG